MTGKIKTDVPRVKKKWNENDTLHFVELYEAEPVLWDHSLKNYKNREDRNAALRRIVNNLNLKGVTVQDIVLKINNIRTTYVQEKKKINKSLELASEPDDVYRPSVPWYDVADRFLANVVKPRKTISETVDSEDEVSKSISKHHTISYSDDPHVQVKTSDSPTRYEVCSSPEISSQTLGNGEEYLVPRRKRKRRVNNDHYYYEQALEPPESSNNQSVANREVEDEFHHFGQNIACQLRELPLNEALDVQLDILNMLKDKRQQRLEEDLKRSCSPYD